MPLYAGVCETDITPPPGVWLSGYALRPTPAVAVHDPLMARALVLDNGFTRVALIVADLIAFPPEMVTHLRAGIAEAAGIGPEALLLHATHTHAGPYLGIFRGMGPRDPAYEDVLLRKLIGIAQQAANRLQSAHLTYGESSVQIGVNRRQPHRADAVVMGQDYAGLVAPIVQTLCVNASDGRLFALLFCHACHPTTVGGENLAFSAEWCGAAVNHLKMRFQREAAESGVAPNALPFCLQGCCGDINPLRRGSWEAIEEAGRAVADAAHTARWNAHGHLGVTLKATEVTLELPMLPPPPVAECRRLISEWEETLERDRAANAPTGRLLFDEGWRNWAQDSLYLAKHPEKIRPQPFAIQHLDLGGVHFLGFPGEMFVQYQLDFAVQSHAPVFSLGYTNGCWNYVPTAAEYAYGGYEVAEAYKYYGTLMFAPECEQRIRAAVYSLLKLAAPDTSPYQPQHGRAR